ncbi:hypothetical protein Y032_0197g1587 [Ancylostoma ceylanicum]|uniref:Uncharacterized protein n=1 Tax=Ancylostoma ceylanicum TaxID=53326 RepID=A0A016SPE5_9BILA|nr:hypothetical protein Y032_0197g1587 [Ancylostoma ceylanicum]
MVGTTIISNPFSAGECDLKSRLRWMSLPFEALPQGHEVEIRPRFPLPPGDDELSIVAGRCNQGMLKVIEWDHMNLAVFYPAALTSTWAVRTVLYPLAVLRSRLQLQKQHTVYKNTLDAFINISKKEGFRGLYRARTCLLAFSKALSTNMTTILGADIDLSIL